MKLLMLLVWCACVRPITQSTPAKEDISRLDGDGVEITSTYSTILLRDEGAIRTMYFIRDNGDLALESSLNIQKPSLLLVPYTRIMMGALLFHPKPTRALMIGLGGGAMPHHIQAFHSEIGLDAVDIDPEVVRIAQDYFLLRPNEKLRLHAADGFDFIEKCTNTYDILFMDAFLKPSEETDSTGTPMRLKTMSFYEQITRCLTDKGVVAFNINRSISLRKDIKNIQDAFPQTWVVPVPKRGNVLVFASVHKQEIPMSVVQERAQKMEKDLSSSLSFERVFSVIKEAQEVK